MITLYYHPEKKYWYHCEENTSFIFGSSKQPISFEGSKHEQSLPFSVEKNNEKLGPLVGILTGTKKQSFIGNIPAIKRTFASLQNRGAIGIVITPDSFQKDFVDGYLFYFPLKRWIKVRTPLPEVVYNRIPYRHMENEQNYVKMISFLKENNIPFFNPYFFSKWETFQILQSNHFLKKYLPHTTLFQGKNDINMMLNKHKEIYVKASSGYKGIGLFYLKRMKETIYVETKDKSQLYPSFSSFWDDYHDVFMSEPYIIQEAIQSDRYEGKRYDLRILCHFQKEYHSISGIGVRLSGDRDITTHVPNGGSILPYECVRSRHDEKLLHKLVFEIGKELMNQTGEFIGEFSIDMGCSLIGDYYIYEVNSKPMVFDEEHIKKQGLENLTKLLIMKAKTT